MSGGPATPPASSRTTAPQWRRRLQRVPLPLRNLSYGGLLVLGILAGLPWLAHRIDTAFPGLHLELGRIRLAGAAVFACFAAGYVYCSYQLTQRGKGGYAEWDPPIQFVAEGPYRRVRNPVAACVVGMLAGEAIALSSTGVFLLFLASMPLAHLQVVLLEEPLLRKRFGAVYEQYCRQVPRWIPLRRAGSTEGPWKPDRTSC